MTVFVDTSGLYALFDNSDINHEAAKTIWAKLKAETARLVTSYSVLVETTALLQSRLGLDAVFELNDKFFPLLDVIWIDNYWYGKAVNRHLKEGRRSLGMVDCLSFEIMEAREIAMVFTFDTHFKIAGFSFVL